MPDITLSPGLKFDTEEPVATTTPVPSWDIVMGVAVWKMPERTIRSVWQREATAVRRRRSCSPKVEGDGVGIL